MSIHERINKRRKGYFLRLHSARTLYRNIQSHLEHGGVVQVCTHTRITTYERKHVAMFRQVGTDVQVQRGKQWDSIIHTVIRYGRYVDSRIAAHV